MLKLFFQYHLVTILGKKECYSYNMKRVKTQHYNGFGRGILDSIAAPGKSLPLLFTIEGMLITIVNNLIGNNNNLFATRLGANEFQLGLLITIPQLVGMFVLLPGGILTDRMKNKRSLVITSLFLIMIFYIFIGFVPILGSYSFIAFLLLLAISTGPMTIYNVSWQAYFSDLINVEERNHIITIRTAISFLIGIIIPLASGAILAKASSINDKIIIHQIYFWIGGLLLLLQIFVLKKIKNIPKMSPSKINIKQLKTVLIDLAHNKKFLGFVSVAMFFYLTWHVDWTLYFIGQVNYLKLNEVWLSYISIGNAVIQFVTIGFWSKLNGKYGVRFSIIFGNLGLALCPISMIIATSLPISSGKIVFLILNTLANLTFATVTLNILQCLLQVLPESNKTLNISIYTILVTLSNAFMPLFGVMIYAKLGANLWALHTMFWIIFFLRIISSGLWAFRWWRLRNIEL